MNEIVMIILSGVAGLLLGIFFFGGLRWTVKKGLTAKIPALIFIMSFFIRTLVTLAGFMFVSQGRWERLVSCLIGFIIIRLVLVNSSKLNLKKIQTLGREV